MASRSMSRPSRPSRRCSGENQSTPAAAAPAPSVLHTVFVPNAAAKRTRDQPTVAIVWVTPSDIRGSEPEVGPPLRRRGGSSASKIGVCRPSRPSQQTASGSHRQKVAAHSGAQQLAQLNQAQCATAMIEATSPYWTDFALGTTNTERAARHEKIPVVFHLYLHTRWLDRNTSLWPAHYRFDVSTLDAATRKFVEAVGRSPLRQLP